MFSALRSSIEGPLPIPKNDPSAYQRDLEIFSNGYARLLSQGRCTISDEARALLGLNGECTGPLITEGLLRLSDEERKRCKTLLMDAVRLR